jgi:hypothetical protein
LSLRDTGCKQPVPPKTKLFGASNAGDPDLGFCIPDGNWFDIGSGGASLDGVGERFVLDVVGPFRDGCRDV